MNTLRTERLTDAPLPIPVGGYRWRKARGLETWRDHARRWRALRYTPPGTLCPTPDSLLPCWREART